MSSTIPKVISTEPTSSISISSASTGKRKRPPVISEVLAGNDANLPIYVGKSGKAESANTVRKILSTKNNKRVKQRSMQDVIAMMANQQKAAADQQKATDLRMMTIMKLITANNPASITNTQVIKPSANNEDQSLTTDRTLVGTTSSDAAGASHAAHPSPMEVDIHVNEEKKKSSTIKPTKTDDVSFTNDFSHDSHCTPDKSNNIVVDSNCTTLINKRKITFLL